MMNPIEMKSHVVTDPRHGNMEVYRFEVPEHWIAASAVDWVLGKEADFANDWSNPVNSWARAEDPRSGDAIERFPQVNFYHIPGMDFGTMGNALSGIASWFSGKKPDARPKTPPPLRMFGATSHAPMPAAEALVEMLVVRYRGMLPGYRVLGTFAPPELADLARTMPPGVTCEPVGVRIEYLLGGMPFEEEICAAKITAHATSYGPMGALTQTNWNLFAPYGLRAAKGTLDAKRPLFRQILTSTRPNPEWIALRDRIAMQLTQQFNMYLQQGYDQIYAAGQASRQISANNDALLRDFEQRRQSENASWRAQHPQSPAEAFSDAILDVTTYNDPYWGTSKHDSAYDYVWTDGNGGYRYSNDPGFDPNIGGTVTWQIMQRR